MLNKLNQNLWLCDLQESIKCVDINNSAWATIDANNTSASPNGWPSGTFLNQVEPIGRQEMGAVKRLWERTGPAITTTGSANAYVYTPSNTSYPVAYVTGDMYAFVANFANTSTATLNVNGLGTKNIFQQTATGPAALTGGEIQTGQTVLVGYDGTQFQLISSSSTVGSAVKKVKTQIFTSTGIYTPSTGMLYCIAEGVGGGGGSGGCALTSSSQVAAANGGGGGGYFRVNLTAAQIGTNQAITIGAAGAAGSAGNNAGGAGGTTSIGSLGVAAGGGAGAGGTTVNGNLVQLPSGAVAAGGTGTTGDVLIQGQAGGQAVGLNFTTVGYSQMAFGGSGGSSIFGAGQPATATFGGGSSAGVAGQLYGGGASGPCSTISIGTQAGAAGAKGIIIITEFCSQ